jgi:prepilin-type N-terminal cleavage/methylation domain-containing protein
MEHAFLRRRKGFALVELLVVVAVIALLLAILVPTLSRARSGMHRAKCASNLREIARAMVAYASAGNLHRGTQPYALPSVGPESDEWGDMVQGNPGCFWLMLTGRQPDDTPRTEVRRSWIQPAVLLCPAMSAQGATAPQLTDGQLLWNDERKSYCYSYLSQAPFQDGGQPYDATSVELAPSNLIILADRNPRIADADLGQNSPPLTNEKGRNSRSHGGEGQNAVSINQSVSWMTTPEDPADGGDNIYAAEGGGDDDNGERADIGDSLLIP